MWQYADGAMGPLPDSKPGIGSCDRDLSNGTIAELKQFWAIAAAAQARA